MTDGRPIFCSFIAAAALAVAASSQGCGRLGYDALLTEELGDTNPSDGPFDAAGVDQVVLTDGAADVGQGGDSGAPDHSVAGGGWVDGGGPEGGWVDGGVSASDADVHDGAPGPGMDAMPLPSSAFFSGQYLGTGMSGLKVTGVGFAPDVVIVHARSPSSSLFATRLMSPGRTRVLSDFNASATTNTVTGFGPDGFELGAMTANVSGVVSDYLALKAAPGFVAVGRFVGDGQPRTLTGLGFAPGYVFVACDGRSPMHRSRTMDTTIVLRGTEGGNLITSLDVDGFSLGSDADVNQPGSDCQWFAVREAAGVMATTSFIGNKTAGRLVMLPAGMPQAVFIQCQAATSLHWVWKPLSLGANTDASYPLGNTGPEMNLVTRLLSGGFEVGSDAKVNLGGLRCHAVAFGG